MCKKCIQIHFSEFPLHNSAKVVGRRMHRSSCKGKEFFSQSYLYFILMRIFQMFGRKILDESSVTNRNEGMSARDRLLLLMNSRALSPSTDVNTHSEDGSELSSGVVICELNNAFKR